jgi:hypothetical protein
LLVDSIAIGQMNSPIATGVIEFWRYFFLGALLQVWDIVFAIVFDRVVEVTYICF